MALNIKHFVRSKIIRLRTSWNTNKFGRYSWARIDKNGGVSFGTFRELFRCYGKFCGRELNKSELAEYRALERVLITRYWKEYWAAIDSFGQ